MTNKIGNNKFNENNINSTNNIINNNNILNNIGKIKSFDSIFNYEINNEGNRNLFDIQFNKYLNNGNMEYKLNENNTKLSNFGYTQMLFPNSSKNTNNILLNYNTGNMNISI